MAEKLTPNEAREVIDMFASMYGSYSVTIRNGRSLTLRDLQTYIDQLEQRVIALAIAMADKHT